MVEIDALDALDQLIWRRSGVSAAKAVKMHQSTVSRKTREVLQLLGLQLVQRAGEWDLEGCHDFIRLERQLHQLHRLKSGAPLRLEGVFWWQPVLASPPAGWCTGVFDHLGLVRAHQLLRQRVVDAWLISPPDHPEEDDPDLAVVPLATMPVRLVVGKSHPLAGVRGVTFRDVNRFPTLALPAGLLPKTEKRLQELGLWNSPVRMQFYDHDSWQGQCHDQATINYGSGLSLVQQPHLTTLDLPLNFNSGDALVVHRDLVSSPRIEFLVRHLRGCLQRLIQHQHGFRLAAI